MSLRTLVSAWFRRPLGRGALASLLAFALVVPLGGGDSSAKAAEESSTEAPLVTFTGLRVHEDGSSTVVVNLTRRAAVQFSQDDKELTFLLSGAKVKGRNNKNPLLAQYFHSNVLKAKLDDTKAGAQLVVHLRESVQPEHQMSSMGEGARLRIDIPPPTSK